MMGCGCAMTATIIDHECAGQHRLRDAHQVGQARKHPHAAVQAEDAEHHTVDREHPEQGSDGAGPELDRNVAIEADQVCREPGACDRA